MPYFTFYGGTTSSSSDSISADITYEETQAMWEDYQLLCYRQDREEERRWQEEAELREDKKKYPLFYWKELTNGNT